MISAPHRGFAFTRAARVDFENTGAYPILSKYWTAIVFFSWLHTSHNMQ